MIFELNLKDLCIIKIADNLWKEEEIAHKENIYFNSPIKYKKHEAWDMLTKEVISLLDPELLDTFYTELVIAIDSLGKQKRDFFTYLRKRHIFSGVPNKQLYENYVKDLHWTYYGVVDLEKTIKSWFLNSDCNQWKVYVMASCFCSPELIMKIWLKVKETYKPENFHQLYKTYGGHLAVYWDRYFQGALDGIREEYISSKYWDDIFYGEYESIEENMFRLSVMKGYKVPAEKFFFELSEKGLIKNDSEYFDIALNGLHGDRHDTGNNNSTVATYFKRNQTVEIILLLSSYIDLSNLQIGGDYDFVYLDEINFFQHFFDYLTRWPYVKLVVPFVITNNNCLTEAHYKDLLICLIRKQKKSYFPLSMANIYRNTFLELWKLLCSGLKQNFCSDPKIIAELFTLWDVASLKIIINDKTLQNLKDSMIAKGREKFNSLVKTNSAKEIEEFIDFLIPTKLDKNLRENLKVIYKNLMKGEFDLADLVLKSSKETVTNFKNLINSVILCCYFIRKNQFDLADKFLIWRFNSEIIANDYKMNFIYDSFTVEYVLKLWDEKDDAKEAKLESNNFILWFLEDKSEKSLKNFIKSKFKNGEKLKKFIESKDNNFGMVKELLSWSLMNFQEKKSLKKKCFSDRQSQLKKYAQFMRKNDKKSADEFVNWKFSNDKDSFWPKLNQSDVWLQECIIFSFETFSPRIFGPELVKAEAEEKLEKFVKSWVKPNKKQKKLKLLKKCLKKWPEEAFRMLTDYELKMKSGDYSTDESDIEGGGSDCDLEKIDAAMNEDDDESLLEVFREMIDWYDFLSDYEDEYDSSDKYYYYYNYSD